MSDFEPLDVVITQTEIHLNWGDRFRVLLGRSIHNRTEIECRLSEKTGGLDTKTLSVTWVEPFRKPRLTGGYMTEAPHE